MKVVGYISEVRLSRLWRRKVFYISQSNFYYSGVISIVFHSTGDKRSNEDAVCFWHVHPKKRNKK